MDKMRILFLAANPDGTRPLRLDVEIREIMERLRAGDKGNALESVPRLAVRPGDLVEALLSVRPHIVHFSGHGGADGSIYLEADDHTRQAQNRDLLPLGGGSGSIAVDSQLHPVQPDVLADVFRAVGGDIRTVLINACFSKLQAEALETVVDSVIGMNKPIGDKAAIVFASGFYQGLAYGRPIQQCFDLGKARLRIENIPEHETPVILGKREKTSRPAASHVLHDFPTYPAVEPGTVPDTIAEAFATNVDAASRPGVIMQANNFRREANPDDPKVGKIKAIKAAPGSEFAIWQSVFFFAGLQGPRMLAALLLTVDDSQFTDEAKRDRENLLERLKTWKG
jgi:hypothetical protein